MISTDKIILGTAQLGLDYGITNTNGKPSRKESEKILKAAHGIGIRVLDTAVAYGDSESVIGSLSNARFEIVSKWMTSPEELEGSLERLHSTKIHAWLAHRPEKLADDLNLWHRMKDQQLSGKVEKVGISVYDITEVRKLWALGIEPDVVQIPVNLLDPRAVEFCDELHEHGAEIHARSIFLQGVLLVEPSNLPSHFDPIKHWLKDFALQFPSTSMRARALIDDVLNRVGADRVVLGGATSDQVEQWLGHVSEQETLGSLPSPPASIDKSILTPSMWPSNF